MTGSPEQLPPAETVNDVLITDELARRPARPADFAAENRALLTLADEFAKNPGTVLQRVAELAVELCHADSAGISILEPGGSRGRFRWRAVAGLFAENLERTIPREASPCGAVLDRKRPLLFSRPARFFPALRDVQPAVYETLLVPWQFDGSTVGTLWVIAHQPAHGFDREDVRLLTSLSRFAAAAYSVVERARATDHLRAQRSAALNLMEDAIVAREQAEQASGALRESEDRLRTLADAVPQIIWANDGSGVANYFNRRWYEYSGLTPEESIGPGWQAIVHPDDASTSQEAWRRALAVGEVFDREYRLRGADGRYRWFIGRNVPLRDAEGRVSGWFGTATDIHDLKEAQEALRAGEERFRIALEAAEMAAWDFDTVHDRVIWNEQHYLLLGLWPDGKPKRAEDFLRWVHPEDLELVRQRLRTAVEDSGIYRADFRIIRADGGGIRWMSGFGRAMKRQNGRAARMTGVMFDTTERLAVEESLRAAEERVRLIVENARDYVIFSADLDRRVTTWNPGAQNILGFAESEILGESGDIIFTAEDRAAGAPDREAETALRERRAADERWHVRKDGTRFWGSGVMMAMHDPAGKAIGFVKILRDETEARQAQEALEKALQEADHARGEAEAAGRAKDHFLAVLSHELRTPLTPVLMAVRALSRRKDLPAQVSDALEMIQRNVQLEAHFVDDLLDVTRIGRGKMELVHEPLDLHDVVRSAVEVSRPDFEAKEQQIEVSLAATARALTGDAKRLQQVFWNLVKNASKFTPEGGALRVLTRNDSGRIIVEVHDTGIGFEPADADRIFEPFTQGSEEVTREFGGLGLGLGISKATVTAHGGTIAAWSPGPGLGSIFTVSLPAT